MQNYPSDQQTPYYPPHYPQPPQLPPEPELNYHPAASWSLIVGIAALIGIIAPKFGLVAGAIALLLGVIGFTGKRYRQGSKVLATFGLIAGFVALSTSALTLAGVIDPMDEKGARRRAVIAERKAIHEEAKTLASLIVELKEETTPFDHQAVKDRLEELAKESRKPEFQQALEEAVEGLAPVLDASKELEKTKSQASQAEATLKEIEEAKYYSLDALILKKLTPYRYLVSTKLAKYEQVVIEFKSAGQVFASDQRWKGWVRVQGFEYVTNLLTEIETKHLLFHECEEKEVELRDAQLLADTWNRRVKEEESKLEDALKAFDKVAWLGELQRFYLKAASGLADETHEAILKEFQKVGLIAKPDAKTIGGETTSIKTAKEPGDKSEELAKSE